MKKGKSHNLIALALCAVILVTMLSGCGFFKYDMIDLPDDPSADSEPGVDPGEEEPATDAVSMGKKTFALSYSAGETFNPFKGTNARNIIVGQTMYETLFNIGADFMAEPSLCSGAYTEDGITYKITVNPGIFMHDGSEMSPADVAYSINTARSTARFSSRLRDIRSAAAGEDGVTVILKEENYSLPLLLDIPVVKDGTGHNDIPVGTGAYYMPESGGEYLLRFSKHRDVSSLPVDRIYLYDIQLTELINEFSSGRIDILFDDPTDSYEMNVRVDCERRYFDTAILHYVGFNVTRPFFSEPDMRRAISCAVNRDDIVSGALGGYAIQAPAPASAAWALYDKEWGAGAEYSMQKLSEIFSAAGIEDSDGNRWLEYLKDGVLTEITVDFIVDSGNAYRAAAAKKIADALKSVGINVTLRALPWEEYTAALEEGDFDMYYGETRLTSDFDLAPILASEGALNYGGVADARCDELISAVKSAAGDSAKKAACGELYAYILENAPVISVAFKKQIIITPRDVIKGLAPVQSSVFYNITEWTINLAA